MNHPYLTRRDFLRLSGLGFGATVLAACSPRATEAPTSVPTSPSATEAIQPTAVALEEPRALVGDVLDFA
ncbi:MAG TPA: twin-arginine translocation signal domain-containing protein, partial [Candidatus Tectomicrobia bacterium]